MRSLKATMIAGMIVLALAGGARAQQAAAPAVPAPAEQKLPETCYLFSYFTPQNGETGLHLAWSTDGYAWKEIDGVRGAIKPAVEGKLMRDPFLMLGPDGVFRLVWTTAWNGKVIGYASSKDLIHWSAQKAISVMAQEPNTVCCWAPELYYNKDQKHYLIIWSSAVRGKFNGDKRTYSVTTTDFETFTPARMFFDPGFNVIDDTMTQYNGKYYLIHKDEREKQGAEPAKKNLRISTSDSMEGPWSASGEPFTEAGLWAEGPTTLKVGDETIVYFDCYTKNHYGAMKTKDFAKWEDVTARLAMPRGVRHGNALPVPAKVIEALRKAAAAGGGTRE